MTQAPWQNHFWTPEPLWRGDRVFILASGPSLTNDTAAKVRGHRTIALNGTTFSHAPWASCWHFMDNSVFVRHRDAIAAFPGLVVTCSRKAKREMGPAVHRVQLEHRPDFPPPGAAVIRWGRSTGHTAVSLALALGARRVVLLGYDMRAVDGRTHGHDDYRGKIKDPDLYAREFIPGFDGWRAAALAAGCEVVNATLGSALTEFPAVDLDAELAG